MDLWCASQERKNVKTVFGDALQKFIASFNLFWESAYTLQW